VTKRATEDGVGQAGEKGEAGEVRCDNCWRGGTYGHAQRGADGEPVAPGVEEHERAVVAAAGEIEAGESLTQELAIGSLPFLGRDR
jgi:hypothetical protein